MAHVIEGLEFSPFNGFTVTLFNGMNSGERRLLCMYDNGTRCKIYELELKRALLLHFNFNAITDGLRSHVI